MRESNTVYNSMKMASENVDKTKYANKVTFFKSEKNTENHSDRFSKRTQTPSLRKTQSLLVLKTTKDVGISSSVFTSRKTPEAHSDDVMSITSSVSTSSSSDGRGRSIRRRLPPLPRHEPGTVVAPREGRRHRLRQQQQQQQQQQRCTETDGFGTFADLLLPVETEGKMASGSTCRPRANPGETGAVRPGSHGSPRLSIAPADEGRRSSSSSEEEDAALSRKTFQEETAASKRHLVSKTTSKEEIPDKNRDQRESYSLQIPFFLPLNHQISSVDGDSEDDEEADDEVNSPRREDHLPSDSAPKSNARKAELNKVPHPVQNYLETTYLMWPKTGDISTEKDRSETALLADEILDRRENIIRAGERQKGRRSPIDADRDASSAATTSQEEDDDVTRMSSKDQNAPNGSRANNGHVEWEENRIFQSSSFPIPLPSSSLSLHLLLQNYLLIPVTLFGFHPSDDLGMTFAKKPLLWRHFTETLGGAFRPVATNENGSLLLGVVMVTHVAKGTSAEANGLTVGDVVVELNGTSVLRSSADDVRRLLTSSGRRVDLVLARSRSSLHQMAERSLRRWEENSGEVRHSTAPKGRRPQLTDSFHRKEFQAKHPQKFDKDDETEMKQQRNHSTRKQNRQHLASSMHSAPEEQRPYIRHSTDEDDDHHRQNPLFDPDYGWQKISAV